MGESSGTAGRDPRQPAVRARARLRELKTQLRDDCASLADPATRALFVNTAELLGVLEEAFAAAQTRSESVAGT